MTGCQRSEQNAVLEYSVAKLKEFQLWQASAIDEIQKLREMVQSQQPQVSQLPPSAVLQPNLQLPAPSCNMSSMRTGQVLEAGFIMREFMHTNKPISSDRFPGEVGTGVCYEDFHSESQMFEGLMAVQQMIRTGCKFRNMRHKYRWRGLELLADITFSIICDADGWPDKGIWTIHPIKIGPKLSEKCSGGLCSLMCCDTEDMHPVSVTRPGIFQELLTKLEQSQVVRPKTTRTSGKTENTDTADTNGSIAVVTSAASSSSSCSSSTSSPSSSSSSDVASSALLNSALAYQARQQQQHQQQQQRSTSPHSHIQTHGFPPQQSQQQPFSVHNMPSMNEMMPYISNIDSALAAIQDNPTEITDSNLAHLGLSLQQLFGNDPFDQVPVATKTK